MNVASSLCWFSGRHSFSPDPDDPVTDAAKGALHRNPKAPLGSPCGSRSRYVIRRVVSVGNLWVGLVRHPWILPDREDSQPDPFVHVQRDLTCRAVLDCALALMIEQVVEVLPNLVVCTHAARPKLPDASRCLGRRSNFAFIVFPPRWEPHWPTPRSPRCTHNPHRFSAVKWLYQHIEGTQVQGFGPQDVTMKDGGSGRMVTCSSTSFHEPGGESRSQTTTSN